MQNSLRTCSGRSIKIAEYLLYDNDFGFWGFWNLYTKYKVKVKFYVKENHSDAMEQEQWYMKSKQAKIRNVFKQILILIEEEQIYVKSTQARINGSFSWNHGKKGKKRYTVHKIENYN